MPLILLLVPVIELLGFLGFIYLASIAIEPSFRYFPLMAAAITVILLFARETGTMSVQQLALTAALLSLLSVAAFQILGLVHSGVAKDIDLISFDNLVRLAVILAVALVVHGSALAACRFLRRH